MTYLQSKHEKKRQQELTSWLKKQGFISRWWFNISRLLGLVISLLIVTQTWLLAHILNYIIIETIPREALSMLFISLVLVFIFRTWIVWLRERVGFYIGQHIRYKIRCQVLDKLAAVGPIWIRGRSIGSWSTLILEQIDDMHEYYARYLPQVTLSMYVPLLIIITILPNNWVAALILLITAPLIPLFITLVGMGAEEANRRNFHALGRLSGYFLDRLRGMETLRIFGRSEKETENIHLASKDLRRCTMEVLRLAFLSSAVLEFFTSLAIALVAVYFGFYYLGALNFGYYNTKVTLSTGFLVLILAPEFFQPLRDLGTFYHAKAKALGAADSLKTFLETPLINKEYGNTKLNFNKPITLLARDFSVLSPEGIILVGPLNFTLSDGQRIAIVGASGSGKSSLLNALLGFMTYTGSLSVNGNELRTLDLDSWRTQLSWVGQHPQLPAATIRENILLGCPGAKEEELQLVLDRAQVREFLPFLRDGIETAIGDQGIGLSIGQAQRVAVARALIHPCKLLLLDEPAANLDAYSEQCVMQAIDVASRQYTTLMVTHQLENITDWDNIWVMNNGCIVEQGDFNTLATAQGYFTTLLSNRQENT